ncbi:hypothetical protein FBU30_004699 [Linnemannia zychae]|nr:hypothetical protein FBU30_004699 [Linnemannia zychae]
MEECNTRGTVQSMELLRCYMPLMIQDQSLVDFVIYFGKNDVLVDEGTSDVFDPDEPFYLSFYVGETMFNKDEFEMHVFPSCHCIITGASAEQMSGAELMGNITQRGLNEVPASVSVDFLVAF